MMARDGEKQEQEVSIFDAAAEANAILKGAGHLLEDSGPVPMTDAQLFEFVLETCRSAKAAPLSVHELRSASPETRARMFRYLRPALDSVKLELAELTLKGDREYACLISNGSFVVICHDSVD